MLAVVPVTGMLGFGFGYLVFGGHRVLTGTGAPYELAAPAALAVAVALFWIGVRRRLQAYGAAAADAPTLTVAEPPGPRLPGRSSPTPGTA